MKILHIVSSATMTGPGDPALNLAAAQRHALGHDVWIAYDQIREGNMIHKVPQYDVPVVEEVATCTKGGVLTALRDRKTVRKLADDFDLIHCHSSHDHGLAALARGKAVLVRSIHHHRSARKRAFQSIAYNRTDGFIFVAEAHREQFLGNYSSIAREQTTGVTGAVDTDWFNDEVDGLKFRDDRAVCAQKVCQQALEACLGLRRQVTFPLQESESPRQRFSLYASIPWALSSTAGRECIQGDCEIKA